LRQFEETSIIVVILIIFAWLLFGPFTIAEKPLIHIYMFFPLLIWIAFRLTPRGVAHALLLFAVIATWSTLQGHGIFSLASQTRTEQLVSLQIFLSVVTCSGLLLSAIVTARNRAEEGLRESEERWQMLFENAPDPIFIRAGADFAYLNRAAVAIFGAESTETLLGTPVMDRIYFSSKEIVAERMDQLEQLKIRLPPLEQVFNRMDSSPVSVEVSTVPIDFKGQHGALVFARDISERKQVETLKETALEALLESEERFRSILQDVRSISVQGYKLDGMTQYWNQASERLYGYSEQEAIGRNIVDLIIPPEMRRDVEQAIKQMGETGQPIPSAELSLMRKDGSRVAVFSSHTIVQIPGRDQELFCIDIDLTERKEAEEKIRLLNIELEQLAVTDYLTNLFNRRYFMQRSVDEFKRAHRNGQPLAMLMLDIDHFKKVNDAFGHEAGDLALQQVAAALKSSVREIDMLGRMGGEEFAVLLPNTLLPDAALLGERIRLSITNLSLQTAGGALIGTITISVGAAAFSAEMASIDDLLRNADTAMYHAKNSGRNRVEMY
jgi:diguanylate cyclase (GGDEF)-like protein/PAS domain S-box-containing protein